MIEVGKIYVVKSQRKGTFIMRITVVNDEWVTGEILTGRAKAIMEYNEREAGDEITVRRSMTVFTEQPPG